MLKLNISSGRVLEQLKLPVPLDEFKRKVDEIRAAGQPNIAPTVLNADSSVPALNWHLQQTRLDSDSTLQKLNQLAETIDGMNAAEHYHLSKSLDPESQQSLDDVLRIAAHIKPASLACYEVIPGVTSHQELGRWLVEHDRLEDKVPETLRPYLDYRSIGIDYCNSHEGEFLADSYTGIQSGAMEQVLEEQGVLRLTLSTAKGTFPLSFPASDERLEQAKGRWTWRTSPRPKSPPSSSPLRIWTASSRWIQSLWKTPIRWRCAFRRWSRRTGELMKFLRCSGGGTARVPSRKPSASPWTGTTMNWSRRTWMSMGNRYSAALGLTMKSLIPSTGIWIFPSGRGLHGRGRRPADGVRSGARLSKPFPPAPEIGQAMM